MTHYGEARGERKGPALGLFCGSVQCLSAPLERVAGAPQQTPQQTLRAIPRTMKQNGMPKKVGCCATHGQWWGAAVRARTTASAVARIAKLKPAAKCCATATCTNWLVACLSSRTKRRASDVRPGWPGADPFLARRRLAMTRLRGRIAVLVQWRCLLAWIGIVLRAAGGLS